MLFLNVAGGAHFAYAQTVQATQSKTNSLEDELVANEDLVPAKSKEDPNKKKEDAEKADKAKAQMSLASMFSQDLQHSIKGFSVGALAFDQSYNSNVSISLNGTGSRVSSKTPDIYYVGGVARYTVFPYEKIGTDLGFTFANSVNHSSLNIEAVTYMKTEVNLGYSWITRAGTPTYIYGGVGYESFKSKGLENFASSGGGSIQLGIGANYSKNISFEGVYSMARHPVANGTYDALSAQATKQGFTTVDFDKGASYVTTNMFEGRVLFRF
ncbi:MAG: hypothetical protein ACXWQQ_09815 [Pseudobdellovibrio sp.]